MLSSGNDNTHQLCYWDSNYIHVVQISKEEARNTLESQFIKCPNDSFPDERSNTLLSQLYLMREYSENNNSALSVVFDFLTQYGDQFTYLGHYIKYIFPRIHWRNVMLQYGSLIIPQSYEASINSIIADSEESKKYRDDILKILFWLNQNGVGFIGNPRINIRESLNNMLTMEEKSSIVGNALVSFYRLDINSLSKSLEELHNAQLTYSKQDLLYPLLLCKIGRYKQAYDIYKKLASIMMEKRKYVLYFLCLYNMQSLYGPVFNVMEDDGLDLVKSFMEEIKSIDLNEVVKSLPLNEIMQRVLSDLANGRYLVTHLLDAEQYCDKVREQRESSERGGASINDNINHVLWHYDELIDFCNNNYIYDDTSEHTKETYLKIAESVIQSLLTKEHSFGASKLPYLYGDLVRLFVFHLRSCDLQRLLNKIAINKKIQIDNSFKNEINNILNNLNSSKNKFGDIQKVVNGRIVGECLKNIICLSLYIEEYLELPNIGDLISDYWYEGGMLREDKLLADFFEHHKVSGDEAIRSCLNFI